MPDWVRRDVTAKRALLAAHGIQHRCVTVTPGGDFEFCDDQPCLVRQLAAAESTHQDYGAWK
jgi:hypothetical protein